MNDFHTRIQTSHGEITLRPYQDKDFPFYDSYLHESPRDFLSAMGMDVEKLNDRADWTASFKRRMTEASENGKTPHLLFAELDGRAIAAISYDLRQNDGTPRLHFHIFEAGLRGKGLGGPIFLAGVKAFSRMYGATRFLVEPRATNTHVNKLAKKYGLRHIKDHLLPAGPVTIEMVVSQYELLLSDP